MGRSPTCRSTDADRRDYSWVDTPSDPEVPSGKPPGGQRVRPIGPLYLWARRQVVQDPAPKDGEADDRGPGQQGPPESSGAQPDCRCHHVAGAGGHGARRSGDADPDPRRGRCAQADAAGASGVCTWPNTTLQVLQGRGRLMTSEASWEWVRATTCRSAHPAPVGELGRRRRPVDPGRDTIQLRETPGNLSNSGSETHQISGQPVLIAASRC